MSTFARSSVIASRAMVRPAARQSVRFASGHGEVNTVGHTLPMSVKNKPWLAIRIIAFGVTGFGLPFYAAYWHLSKAGT